MRKVEDIAYQIALERDIKKLRLELSEKEMKLFKAKQGENQKLRKTR